MPDIIALVKNFAIVTTRYSAVKLLFSIEDTARPGREIAIGHLNSVGVHHRENIDTVINFRVNDMQRQTEPECKRGAPKTERATQSAGA